MNSWHCRGLCPRGRQYSLSSDYKLGLDKVLFLQVVLARRVVMVTQEMDLDLFWALRDEGSKQATQVKEDRVN